METLWVPAATEVWRPPAIDVRRSRRRAAVRRSMVRLAATVQRESQVIDSVTVPRRAAGRPTSGARGLADGPSFGPPGLSCGPPGPTGTVALALPVVPPSSTAVTFAAKRPPVG